MNMINVETKHQSDAAEDHLNKIQLGEPFY